MKRVYKTTEQFISDASVKHNNLYDYSESIYINSKTKIIIGCPIHGVFEQIPNDHLNGSGCSLCGIRNNTESRTKDIEQFISEASIKHNNIYDYSESVYVNNRTKLRIGCSIHGIFEQNPTDHLNGSGCLLCGIQKLNGRYNITNANKPDKIDLYKSTIVFVYMFRFYKGDESFYKIGITKNLKKRFNSYRSNVGYITELIDSYETNLYDAIYIELKNLDRYKEYKYIPQDIFPGKTECFKISDNISIGIYI